MIASISKNPIYNNMEDSKDSSAVKAIFVLKFKMLSVCYTLDRCSYIWRLLWFEWHILHRCKCVHPLDVQHLESQMHPHKLATSSIASKHAHSRKQTVKLTYSLSYLRLVNKCWEAVKAGKLSKPETTVRLMNWAASQHNISSSLGLKQTTQLLIGPAAWSGCEECTLPTSTVASQRLEGQQQDRLSVIESLHRYVTAWSSAGCHWVTV